MSTASTGSPPRTADRASAATPWQGRWERLSLSVDDGPTDTSTRVVWLQTALLYGDLRIPADRPTFDGCRSLLEMDDHALHWLATQQGFAGHLESTGDICFWHRHIDFRPPSYLPDAGRMRTAGDRVVETGLFQSYTEVWRRSGPAVDDVLAAKLLVEGGAGEAALRQGFLLAQGDSFMFALERRTPPERRAALWEGAFVRHERAALLEALDFEISLGTRRNGSVPWAVTLSTLPFVEGRSLMTLAALADGQAGYTGIDRGILRHRRHHWLELERGAGFRWL